MSLRALWIIAPFSENKVLYSRVFPSVDTRAKRALKDGYVPVPKENEFAQVLLVSVGIDQKVPQFVEWRDSCLIESTLPVVEFQTQKGRLWPVLVIEHYNLLLCCLPFVKECYVPLIECPGVSMGCVVMQNIAGILGALTANQDKLKLSEVDSYISLSLPLGTPYDTDPQNVMALLSLTESVSSTDNQKVSSWKPIPHHGKNSLAISIREYVRSTQWGHSFLQSDVYGNVLVRSQLEGPRTDVTIALSSEQGSLPPNFKTILYHPCIHNTTLTQPENVETRKLKFRPPLQQFSLCSFIYDPKEPPIGGIYELSTTTMWSNRVKIYLNLRLSQDVRNNFEFLEAKLPFPNRSPIRHANCTPSVGAVQLSEDKQMLLWNLGHSFPSKSLEAMLTAEIQFEMSQSELSLNRSSNGSMSTYAQIHFAVKDFAISRCCINPKSIQISPALRANMQIDRSFRSTDYKIWNRNGSVPFTTDVVTVK